MDTNTEQLVEEIKRNQIDLNKRITKLMMLVAIVFCFNLVSQTIENISNDIAMAKMSDSRDRMVEKIVEDYFITDYDYGTISQTQTNEMKVGE